MSFADNIRHYRTVAGLTQEQLAAVVGVSAQAVSKWENDDSMPDTPLLPSIADALNTTIDILFDYVPKSVAALYPTISAMMKGFSDAEDIDFIMKLNRCGQYGSFGIPFSDENNPKAFEPGQLDQSFIPIVETSYYHDDDTGFAMLTESPLFPYAAVLKEPAGGWAALLDSQAVWRVIHSFGDEDIMKCVRYLLGQHDRISIESRLFLKRAGCSPERKDEILEKLYQLQLIHLDTVEIDGSPQQIISYYRHIRGRQILLFLAAAYASDLAIRGHHRSSGIFNKTI